MSTKGILLEEVTIGFMDHQVTPTLHHIGPGLFRVKFYVNTAEEDQIKSDGCRIDIWCSDPFMRRCFEFQGNLESFKPNTHPHFTQKSLDNLVPSLKYVDWGDFDLEQPIRTLEQYAYKNYFEKQASFMYGVERSNLINQVRINLLDELNPEFDDDAPIQCDEKNRPQTIKELWIVQEVEKLQVWRFICQTMFDLPSSEGHAKRAERTHVLKFQTLAQFGVEIRELRRTETLMFVSFFLNSLILRYPEDLVNKEQKDEITDDKIYIE